jgi:methionyl aminopeptidase
MNDLDVNERNPRIRLYKREDFAHMHRAGRLAAACLDMLVEAAIPGVTTAYLDRLCVEFARDNKCVTACRATSRCSRAIS